MAAQGRVQITRKMILMLLQQSGEALTHDEIIRALSLDPKTLSRESHRAAAQYLRELERDDLIEISGDLRYRATYAMPFRLCRFERELLSRAVAALEKMTKLDGGEEGNEL